MAWLRTIPIPSPNFHDSLNHPAAKPHSAGPNDAVGLCPPARPPAPQVLTQLPPFSYLTGTTFDGRLWDEVRGVGAVVGNRFSAVDEQDILELEIPLDE